MAKKKNFGPRGPRTTENIAPDKVKMKFSEHKYYNDLDKPIFMAGEVYELEGVDWIQRWLKRGGEIIEGEVQTTVSDEQNPSTIVGQGGEQTGDKGSGAGETTPEADKGKADGGTEPDADETEGTDAE